MAVAGISASSLRDNVRSEELVLTNAPEDILLDKITVPIEVMGEDGTTVTLKVMAQNVNRAERMYVKAHSISYPAYFEYGTAKASFRLNGGKWVDINNKNVDCLFPEREYGCTRGPYATIRFWVRLKDLGKLREGVNRIDFRFNYEAGDISSGYRILEFDFTNKDGSSAIQQTEIVQDDPSTWMPSLVDSNRIENGRRLYESRNVLRHSPGGRGIRAACNDCHANNARDLKYFNYSDHSIITRSKFHGLTQQEGEDIAAWVRSQSLTDKEGNEYMAPGRPWNPPYQPGPSLGTKSVDAWAAGAGLEWVLDHDLNTLKYLFPSSPMDVIQIDSTLNRMEMPIALQLVDWNGWLPVVHPMDNWQQVFESSRLRNNYDNILQNHIRYPENAQALVTELKVIPVVETFYKDVVDFATHDGGRAMPEELNRLQMGEARASLFKWHLVKMWDFMHTNHFEGITGELYIAGEERGWFSQAQTFSSASPQIHDEQQVYMNELFRAYYNTAWDELQVIMNSGHRETVGGKPVDWAYHFEHIRDWKKTTGISHGSRYVAGYIKVLQNANNRHGVKMPDGFYLGHTSLAWVYELGMPDAKDNVLYDFEVQSPELRKAIAEAFVKEVLKKLQRHDYNEWDRSLGQSGIGPPNYVPTSTKGNPKKGFVFDEVTYADHFYRIIPLYKDLGVDSALLEELARWGRGAWPQGDWESVLGSD